MCLWFGVWPCGAARAAALITSYVRVVFAQWLVKKALESREEMMVEQRARAIFEFGKFGQTPEVGDNTLLGINTRVCNTWSTELFGFGCTRNPP